MKLKKLSETEQKIVRNKQWTTRKQNDTAQVAKDFLAMGEDVMEIEREQGDKRQPQSIMQLFKRSILNNGIHGVVSFTAGNRVFLARGEYPENMYRSALKSTTRSEMRMRRSKQATSEIEFEEDDDAQ